MSTNSEIRDKIFELLNSKSAGVSNGELQTHLGSYPPEVQLAAINDLIKSNQVDILTKGDGLIYRLKEKGSTQDMDNDEIVIYKIIEASKNTGIWSKDIRTKSNLAIQRLNKMLKAMESRKLIKAVKSVAASKKKVYMLYDIEPARSITGGAWYQDSDFETEYNLTIFVDVLNTQCLKFLNDKRAMAQKSTEGPKTVMLESYCSVQDVHKFIKNLQISKIDLSEDDLEDILKTVVYDGKAQRIVKSEGVFYRAIDSLLPPEGLVQSPCGICPVIAQCSSVGSITPKTCTYMKEWLE